jgi:hypothetical protein
MSLQAPLRDHPRFIFVDDHVVEPPTSVGAAATGPPHHVPGRVFTCVFDDAVGLANRDDIGMEQIMFETGYPHADSTFPGSRPVAPKMIAESRFSDGEARLFVRGNAIQGSDHQRYGIKGDQGSRPRGTDDDWQQPGGRRPK